MPPSGWTAVRRLLVVRLDNVGDAVMLGPALRALRRALPAVHLTLMASPAGSQVAPLLPWIDDVMTERVVWQDASGALALDPAREFALVDAIRARSFDAAIIFTSFSQSPYPAAYACYLAGIPIRVAQSKEFGGSLLSTWVRPGPDRVHQVDRNLALIEAAGFDIAGRELELRLGEPIQAEADALLRESGLDPREPFVVVAPTASCEARTYPLARFQEVIAALPAATGLPVIVVGSRRDRPALDPVVAPLDGVTTLVGRTSVPQLAALMRRAALAVVNNSGPMHLADAFGRPLVVLYSGSEFEEQWRPRASRARLLGRPTACSPCYRFTCPYGMPCLDVPPSEVIDECLALLAETPGRQARRQAATEEARA